MLMKRLCIIVAVVLVTSLTAPAGLLWQENFDAYTAVGPDAGDYSIDQDPGAPWVVNEGNVSFVQVVNPASEPNPWAPPNHQARSGNSLSLFAGSWGDEAIRPITTSDTILTSDMWVYPDSGGIFGTRSVNNNGESGAYLFLYSGSLKYYLNGFQTIASGVVLGQQWNHLVVVADRTSPRDGGGVGQFKVILNGIEYDNAGSWYDFDASWENETYQDLRLNAYGYGAWVDDIDVSAIPEPATLALLGLGGLLLRRRRTA